MERQIHAWVRRYFLQLDDPYTPDDTPTELPPGRVAHMHRDMHPHSHEAKVEAEVEANDQTKVVDQTRKQAPMTM